MNFLYSLFGKKYSTLFCILLSLGSRTVNVFFSSFAGRDKMRLILQSKNFLQGKGLSVQQFFFNNPEAPLIDNAQLWPPGYPLLIAPFLKLFNYNIYQSTTTLELLAAIGIIFITRKICRQLGFPLAAINLMTLIVGCFEYPAISDSQPTDAISLLFFLLSISFSLKFVTSDKISFSQTVLTAFFLFLPCFFRYAYPPLSITVPIVIVFYGLVMRNKLLTKKGVLLTGMTMAMILLLFIVLKNETGSATYLQPTERGFFLSNLGHWYPVIPSSFIDLPFLTSQCIKYTDMTLKSQLQILEIINIVVILILSWLFFYSLVVKKSFINSNALKWFILWSFACSMMIFLTLGYLSFTYRIQTGYLNVWTYIYEARYYAIVTLFIQLIFIGWIFLNHTWKKKIVNTNRCRCLLHFIVHRNSA